MKYDFDTFWDAYGLKRDRFAAEPVWKRLSYKDKRAALAGIEPYRSECQRTGVAMMYAVRYLKHRRWEDEIDTCKVSGVKFQVSGSCPAKPANDTIATPPPTKDTDIMEIW